MEPVKTITEFEREALHLVLHVREEAEEESTILSLIREFASILIDHEGDRARDELSSQLWTQGHSFMVYGAQNISKPSNEFLSGAISRIEQLKNELIWEHTNEILCEPWLAAGIVWEKSDLVKYQGKLAASGIALVDEQPHVFAKKVISWLAKIPLQGSLQVVPYVGTNKELKLKKYEKMIGQVRTIRAFKAMNRVMQAKLDQTLARQHQDLIRWEEMSMEQIAEFRRSFSNLRDQYQETTKLQNERNSETQSILGIVRNDLVRANAQITNLQAQVAHAWACIHSQQAQINDLNNQDSGCSIM